MKKFDAIVIGAGQAGPSLVGRLTGAGMKVALIERKLFGGTCVNTGCIPTKTLIASAYAAEIARRSQTFGITVGKIEVDMKAVKARKDAVSAKSRTGVESWLRGMDNCTVYHDHARLESATTVRVGDELLTAPQIFLNVGGRAAIPNLPGVDDIPYLTNTGMLALDHLPEHLVVVGGSYIGLEFAQMYRRFGSKVTVVERGPRLLAHEDEDVSLAVRGILENEGIEIRTGAECIRFEKRSRGVWGDPRRAPHDQRSESIAVGVNCDPSEVVGSHVLLAMGRRPNTDDLGLDKAGVEIDKHGYVTVDDQLRTSVPGIWALGDCNGRGGFTHTAYNDFEIVAANLLDNDPRRVSDRIQAHALYTDPPLGQVGMTETEVRASGKAALIATRPMTQVGRAVEKGETQGFMKVLVDAESHKILGASILGTGGDEAIHVILSTMYAGAPYTALSRAMHIHPTVSELIPTLLQSLKLLS